MDFVQHVLSRTMCDGLQGGYCEEGGGYLAC